MISTRALRAAGLMVALAAAGCGDMISMNRQYREQGLEQYNKGQYVQSASTLQYAIRQEPGDYTSHYYLGKSYEHMNQPQQAIEQYRTCLRVMSNSMEGSSDHDFRLKALDALAHAIAIEPYKLADLNLLERQPKSVENHFLLAKVYRYSQDPDEAIEHYNQATIADPKDFDVAKEFGLYLEELGQNKRADTELRRAYAMNTRDEQVAAGLRRLGVVPGPSLKDENDLVKPQIPVGPLPEVEVGNTTPPHGNRQPVPGGNTGTSSVRD